MTIDGEVMPWVVEHFGDDALCTAPIKGPATLIHDLTPFIKGFLNGYGKATDTVTGKVFRPREVHYCDFFLQLQTTLKYLMADYPMCDRFIFVLDYLGPNDAKRATQDNRVKRRKITFPDGGVPQEKDTDTYFTCGLLNDKAWVARVLYLKMAIHLVVNRAEYPFAGKYVKFYGLTLMDPEYHDIGVFFNRGTAEFDHDKPHKCIPSVSIVERFKEADLIMPLLAPAAENDDDKGRSVIISSPDGDMLSILLLYYNRHPDSRLFWARRTTRDNQLWDIGDLHTAVKKRLANVETLCILVALMGNDFVAPKLPQLGFLTLWIMYEKFLETRQQPDAPLMSLWNVKRKKMRLNRILNFIRYAYMKRYAKYHFESLHDCIISQESLYEKLPKSVESVQLIIARVRFALAYFNCENPGLTDTDSVSKRSLYGFRESMSPKRVGEIKMTYEIDWDDRT